MYKTGLVNNLKLMMSLEGIPCYQKTDVCNIQIDSPQQMSRAVPKSIIVLVHVNGEPVCMLLDSSSLSNFILTRLADQLKLKLLGSQSVINYNTMVDFKYQDIKERCSFDIINIDRYNLILGTPFLFQHKILMGFNPYPVAIGSTAALPIEGNQICHISSRAADLLEADFEELRDELHEYAKDICKDTIETPLPTLRHINHMIPLIDEAKKYQ
ncbi:hypothetical protein K439DRAFT_1650010 [Ramaria rubella]|nr:hypothetical protein K439DRAFT_1650010 [Ramaria rubella]